ncbi:hypothetical protein [Solibacillus isronensis]|uniref:hypothetical protein n=1 Tax=Solibacillus isronensis TaxID=412383 RepID=UPI0009A5FA1E|nr:hypothetical protein [Solibacillus isronensis]
MKSKIKRKVRLFFKGGLAFLCGGWRNLLEQWSGLLEEVGVLLESLGSLLENRRSPWQEVCSFSRIRGRGRRASGFIRTMERIIRTTAADIR